ncbi:MAG: hypothetical protein QW589_05130 [Candidatus Bathyarchaeia archaeon]
MVIYIVYRAERKVKNRSIIPKVLRKFGGIQLHKSLWQVDEKELKNIKNFLEAHHFIILKRERELKELVIEENRLIDLGSLVVLAFDLPKNQQAGRKAIERLLIQVPHLFLCRSVYAFPQSHGLYGKTITRKISEMVKELGGKVVILPRITIMNNSIINDLIQEAILGIKKRLLAITSLLQQINYNDIKKLKELKVKILKLKITINLYIKWLTPDLYFIKEIQKMLRSLEETFKEKLIK